MQKREQKKEIYKIIILNQSLINSHVNFDFTNVPFYACLLYFSYFSTKRKIDSLPAVHPFFFSVRIFPRRRKNISRWLAAALFGSRTCLCPFILFIFFFYFLFSQQSLDRRRVAFWRMKMAQRDAPGMIDAPSDRSLPKLPVK